MSHEAPVPRASTPRWVRGLAVTLAILGLAAVRAAAEPANGYVGIFGDAAGGSCCIDLNATGGTGTLYVIAVTGGASAGGITGAEFRIAVEPEAPTSLFLWNPTPEAAIVLGSPVDNGGAGSSTNIAFATCQKELGVAGDHVLLGTLTVIHLDAPHRLVVRRHLNPSNPLFACPLFTLCDAPAFTQVCMTLQDGDPELAGQEPAAFVASVNDPACTGASCGFVAVERRDWSGIKALYR